MRILRILLALAPLVSTRVVYKRNTYGDEQVTPAPEPAAPAETPAEQAPVTVEQPSSSYYEAPAPAEPSGYRVKRNTYGDEQITPAPGSSETAATPAEQAPVTVEQSASLNETPAPAEPSGYRAKRNTYGDEQVTPAPSATEVPAATPVEQAPVTVEQPAPTTDCDTVPESASVQPSGYRFKRNTYGDEKILPPPATDESTPTPSEQSPVQVKQPVPAAEDNSSATKTEASGY